MTDRAIFNDFYQGPQRTPIQVERPESKDWIAWNWRTGSWQSIPCKLNNIGEGANDD